MESPRTPRQRFISDFVRELYVILMGLGFINVIRDLARKPSELWEYVLALLLTGIVACYWWNWVVYVEENAKASFSEFVIDFLLLLTMAFLFVRFPEPKDLVRIFLVLGWLDLIWVINDILLDQEERTSTAGIWLRLFKNKRAWLRVLNSERIDEKLFAIAIYTFSLCLVYFLRNTGSRGLLAFCVFSAAIFVQLRCFRGLRRKDGITFRVIQDNEIPRLLAINRLYTDPSLSDGFLLEELAEDSMYKLARKRPARLFVALRECKILAYAKVSHTIDKNLLRSVTFLDPSFQSAIHKADVLHIEQVAVDPGHRGKGIGRSFYEWLLQRYPAFLPCAFVSLQPRCNKSSLRFHATVGFERAALFRRDKYLGYHDFKSVLFVHSTRMARHLTSEADGEMADEGNGDAGDRARGKGESGSEPPTGVP